MNLVPLWQDSHALETCSSRRITRHKTNIITYKMIRIHRGVWWSYSSSLKELTHLILEHAAAEGPDAGEDEVEFVQLLGAVRGRVLLRQQALQQVAQHLHVRDLHDGRDLLEAVAQHVQAGGDVLVEEDRQVGALRLQLSRVDPAEDVPERKTICTMNDFVHVDVSHRSM